MELPTGPALKGLALLIVAVLLLPSTGCERGAAAAPAAQADVNAEPRWSHLTIADYLRPTPALDSAGAPAPPYPYLLGNRLVTGPDAPPWRLHYFQRAVDCGGIAMSPDGRYLLYSATESEPPQPEAEDDATPSYFGFEREYEPVLPTLRLLNVRTGEDTVFEQGACAPVWSASGRIAYVKGDPRIGFALQPYLGRIVVRDSLVSAPTMWTPEPGEYKNLAWAQERLVGYRTSRPRWPYRFTDLVVIDGPDAAVRVLAHQGELVALSPDASHALVTSPIPGREYAIAAQVLRMADGVVVSWLHLARLGLGNIGGGRWEGDRILAIRGIYPGGSMHPAPALAVLSVGEGRLTLEQIYAVGPSGGEQRGWGQGQPFFSQPRRLDGGPSRLGMWFWQAATTWYMTCDLDSQQCERAGPLPAAGSFIENPSRPEVAPSVPD